MDRVEKAARALDDAIDNALIAWGMGWDMDGVMACLKEAKDAAALSAAHAEPVAWEHFCDESYFDMWCVRPTGERAFGVGFHVSSEAEAIALVETLAGKASPRPEAVEEAVKAERERCAKAAEQTRQEAEAMFATERDGYQQAYFQGQIFAAEEIATAIRARGET